MEEYIRDQTLPLELTGMQETYRKIEEDDERRLKTGNHSGKRVSGFTEEPSVMHRKC